MAQWLEYVFVRHGIVGSIPTRGANKFNKFFMGTYLGIKLVDAEPCLGLNNKCIDINQELNGKEVEGYKVVYEDGYISWSPKDIFEKSYRSIKLIKDLKSTKWFKIGDTSISTHQERVVTEMLELDKKITGLDEFIINNPIYKTLPEEEQIRLIQQSRAMSYYFSILIERINNF